MKGRCIRVLDARNGIPEVVRSAWIEFIRINSDLSSPFFSMEFTEVISATGRPVELGVIEEGNKIIGIFPFERHCLRFGIPVGSFLSDYHGVISDKNREFELLRLAHECGLSVLSYSNLIDNKSVFKPPCSKKNKSPIIDLSDGFQSYIKETADKGGNQIKNSNYLLRRLEREIGPVTFVMQSSDQLLFDFLLKGKSEQFRRNGWRDIFSIAWVRDAMSRVNSLHTPAFSGMLSALYVGDKLLAAHFGMRSSSVLHYWFPWYDPEYSRYSPGIILLLKMAEAAPTIGLHSIDLGAGEHTYKSRLMNRSNTTQSGSVEVPGIISGARSAWKPIRKIAGKSRRFLLRAINGKSTVAFRNK